MNINELTLGQVRQLKEMFCNTTPSTQPVKTSYKVGEKRIFRTVTMILTGEIVEILPEELVLKDAAWIADTGRFHKALIDVDTLDEIEPFPDGKLVTLHRGAMLDSVTVDYELPRKAK